jgi:predicted PilT family ATPase
MFKKKNNNQTKDQLVIDTSGLMDGRIQKILSLGFLNYDILIPKFVVLELQTVADKSDKVRRDRAREALSLAGEMIKSGQAKLFEQNLTKPDEVDNMLIELSRKLKAKLYTTDANLQRVAEIQSVVVLNPNELIHGIKLNFIPGENIKLKLSDRGQDKNQAIGYIDGVMIVVKDAHSKIGQTVEAKISNLIETENGHIVFADLLAGHNLKSYNRNVSAVGNRAPNQKSMMNSDAKPFQRARAKSYPKSSEPSARNPRNANIDKRTSYPKHAPKFKHQPSPEDKMLASIEKFGD